MQHSQKFSYDQLDCLFQINSLISSELDPTKALKQTLTILSDKMQLKRGIISAYIREINEIHHDTFGFDDNPQDVVKFLPGEGITGEVVRTGQPIVIPRLDQAPIFLDKTGVRKNLRKDELAFLCVPIHYHDEVIGALSVDREMKDNNIDLGNELYFLNSVADTIAAILNKKLILTQNRMLRDLLNKTNPLGTIIGNSKPMREVHSQISQIADSMISVLITGETGTGKELVAKEIHHTSGRKSQPFITVNCGAIPEGLIESELFGHKKGSFTGAVSDRIGKFEAANNGTLFLDEVGELPLHLQVKLLRALQEKEITMVGSNTAVKVNVRIIAATNRKLEDQVAAGKFRSDLYYWLNVFQLYLPPLRDRGADIMLLSDYFIQKYSRELGKVINRIDTPAIDMLMQYHWPGNVRELENCIERACLLARSSTIHAHDLPPSLQMKSVEQNFEKRGKFESLVRAYEIELITDALKDAKGNQTKAAEYLETTKRIIQYKINQYSIDYKRFSKTGKN